MDFSGTARVPRSRSSLPASTHLRASMRLRVSLGSPLKFSAATAAFQAMCQDARSQNRATRGWRIVAISRLLLTLTHCFFSHAPCASSINAFAARPRKPPKAAKASPWPSFSRSATEVGLAKPGVARRW